MGHGASSEANGTSSWRPRPFQAPRWASGPHAQTLLARWLRPRVDASYRRERFATLDDDFLDVDWGPEPPGGDAPIVLILHGLEGSSERKYVRNLGRELSLRGIRPVAMNFRGCSGETNRALRFYHSGETSDPSWLLERIRDRHPGRRLGVIGFSLGGNIALKMLGERADGGAGLVDAAAVMSVPYDLEAGCALLEESLMGRVYSEYFLRSLRRKIQGKNDALAPHIDLDAARSASTIRAFDDLVTAPINGFADASEYYARCSSNQFLEGIKVPALLLHALDDPFLPSRSVPRLEIEANPHLELLLHERGGHVGFLEGSPGAPRFWGEETCASFLEVAFSSP
ncbi:MAG: alpha/beta fold hydrolase [Gemmatimonadetes bacterium]|nr:alpha/beta fold hydrolase [Gemmatimonadota bacterium]NNF15082.1 alpha/beta fold hydrolase [Gemmatimonadota bacterium]NNL30992.1 alpha/beta fold hydrolase [Gemmatimonadota bacterium]